MSIVGYIASGLSGKTLPGFTRPLVRVAIAGVALCMAVMILAVAIVRGFQQEIKAKVAGFSGHIQVSRYDANQSYESSPIPLDQPFYPYHHTWAGVTHVQPYVVKAGIIKTEDQIQGIVFKGVGQDYSWERFSGDLVRGSFPRDDDTSSLHKVVISSRLANSLMLDTGMFVRMYFISGANGQLRGRKLEVTGIYETGMEEFDRVYVLGHLQLAQRLSLWDSSQVSGFEIFIRNMDQMQVIGEEVYRSISPDLDARSAAQLYPQIFEWLRLQDMNVVIILVLMVLVSAITLISALLIIILERSGMIGVLKALGASNRMVHRIFLAHAASIALKGMLLGNVLGIGLGLLQQYTGWATLDQESYYISHVPVLLEIVPLILLNVGVFIISLLAMGIPTLLVTRVDPARVVSMR